MPPVFSSLSPAQILALQSAGGDQATIAEIRVSGTAPDTTTYIGMAPRGSATSAAVWLVKRIVTTSSGANTAIRWSEGKQIFDNYASLTYT